MHRRSFLACTALAAFQSTRGFAKTSTTLNTLQQGSLTIGTYFVNPPFEFTKDGRRVGFEVDLMQAIATRLELRAVLIDTRWEVMLRQQQEGRYDCIVGGITITPSRRKELIWSTPYIVTTLSIIINEALTPNIRSLADLAKASVAVQAATTDYDAAVVMRARGEIGSIKVYPFDQIADAMQDLRAGRVTAVMKVAPVASWLAQRSPSLRVIAQVPNDPQPLGIGFDRSNGPLREAVDNALSDMKSSGDLAALAGKWGVP